MKFSRSAGGVVIGPNGKVLVVSQHGTSWSLIKGTLEPGEDEETAVKREFEEEAGITQVKFIRKLGSYKRYLLKKDATEDTNHLKTITLNLYTTPQEELRPIDPENPEARWVDPDKVSGLLTHSKDKEFYDSVKDEVIAFIQAGGLS